MRFGTLVGVGVGPGDPELLTLKAVRLLSQAGAILAPASPKNDHSLALNLARPHLHPEAEIVRLDFPMTRDTQVLEQAWERNARTTLEVLSRCPMAAMPCLGDPLTYATFGYLLARVREHEPDVPVQVAAGVCSAQAGAASALHVLTSGSQGLVTLSGVDDPARLRAQLQAADNAVIYKAYRSWPALREILSELPGTAVVVSEVGKPGELITRDLDAVPDKPSYFTLVLYSRNGSTA